MRQEREEEILDRETGGGHYYIGNKGSWDLEKYDC